ncbi:hypothetical protein AYO44_12490, partial [Planctomycetaceae bacterium SCGC AG-212-F19]
MLIRWVQGFLQSNAAPQAKQRVRPRSVPLLFQADLAGPQERLIHAEKTSIRTPGDETAAATPVRGKVAGPSDHPRIVPAIAVTLDSNLVISTTQIKGASPAAGTGAVSSPRNTPSRPKGRVRRRSVPLLFGPCLEGLEDAIVPGDQKSTATPPDLGAAETSRIALVPAAGAIAPADPVAAPPAAGTGAASRRKGRDRRSSVPLLFGPCLEGLEEAVVPANQKSTATPPDLTVAATGRIALVPTDVAIAPAGPVSLVISPIKIDVGPAPACAPPVSDTASFQVDRNGAATQKREADGVGNFTLETGTFRLALSSLTASNTVVEPAKRKRRRSGPLYFRPCLEALEDRLAPALVMSVAAGGNWSAPGTWVGGNAPGTSDTVEIVGTATVTLDTGPTFIAGIQIDSGGKLLGTTHTLHITGTGDASTGNVAWNNLGTFTAGTGTVFFAGTTDTIAGSTTFFNLTIMGGTAATLAASINVTGTLAVTAASDSLDVAGFAVSTGLVSGSGTITDTGAAATFTVSNTATDTFNGAFTGANLSLTANGSKTLTLNKASSYGGATSIGSSATTIVEGILNALPTGTSLDDAGTLDLNGFNQQLAAITGLGTVTNTHAASSSTLTVTVASATTDTFGGTLSDGGNNKILALTKDGAGTLTLTGTNTFSGTTTVNAGTLLVNGDANSAVALTGGTLGGTGTVASIAGTGGTINPATVGTTGKLTTGAATSTISGATFRVDLDDTSTPTSDQLFIGSGGTIALTGGSLSVNVVNSALGDVFTIVSGPITSGTIFSGKPDGTIFASGGRNFLVTYTANAVTLRDVATTSTTLGASPASPSVFGQSVTFSGTVSANGSGNGTPTGSVQLQDGGVNIGGATGTLDGSGNFSIVVSNLPVGSSHQITAVYGGTTNFVTSTSTAVPYTVNQASTTTTLSPSPASPSVLGQSVAFSGTVSVSGLGSGTPTGNVQLQDNSVDIAGAMGTLDGSGNFSINVSSLSVGSGHSITAVYSGDTDFKTSTSTAVPYTVDQAPQITSANNTTFTVGSFGTFTVTATIGFPTPTLSEANTDTLPSGVTFTASTGVLSGTPALGTVNTYTLHFTATNGVSPIATQTFTLIVQQAAPSLATAPTSATVTLGTTPPTLKDSATLTGGASPTGTITFTLTDPNSNVVDTETVTVTGNGTYTTPTGFTLPSSGTVTGTYQWSATYNGDSNNTTANDQGGSAEQTVVNPAAPSITTTPSTTSVALGTSSVTLQDTGVLAGGYNPTGTLTFTLVYKGATVHTETVTVSGNGSYTTTAGYTLPTTGAVTGTYQWNVSYGGDPNDNTATDNNAANERVAVSAASPSITTTPSITSVALGTSSVTLQDAAVLSGSYHSTGTITFTLVYNGNTVDTETVTVSGNGSYTTSTGYTLPTTGTVTGTYQWNATYNGDPNNSTASDNNAANEQVTVSAASPGITTTPSSTSVTLNGSAVTLKDTAVLAGGYHPTGTLTFTLVYNGTTTVDTETVTVSGNGSYTTAGYNLPTTGTVTGAYQWNVSYGGDPNNDLASD